MSHTTLTVKSHYEICGSHDNELTITIF